MAAAAGIVRRNDHDVAGPGRYRLLASRAQIGLPGLEGMHEADLGQLVLRVVRHPPILAVTPHH
jgi:hypothetical protein